MNKVTRINLLFLSLGSIIGSGWLYGAFYTAKAAGNSGILSWIIGGIMCGIIAISYAEVVLNKNFSSLSDASELSFGKSGKILVSLITWIWTALIPPIEVQATVQYASNYFSWIKTNSDTFSLTPQGYALSFFLMILLFFINIFAINTVGKFNKIITIFKVFIPIFVACIFIYVILKNPDNAIKNITTDTFSNGISGMLNAISSCGIAFSFIGFQTAIFLANETDNPQKSVPFAVFGSILIACFVYVLVQISFNLSLPNEFISAGWANIKFSGDSGPIAGLLAIFGFASISLLLYADAIVSPFGTGLSYKISASRVLSNIAENKFLPFFISTKNRFGSPYIANIINLAIGLIFISLVSGWQNMIAILCALIILTMAYVPIYALFARSAKNFDSKFKVKNYNIFSFLSFYFSNIMLLWCGTLALKYTIIIFYVFFITNLIIDISRRQFRFNFIYHIILPVHLSAIGIFAYFKSKNESIYFDLASQFVFSLIIILIVKFYTKKDYQQAQTKVIDMTH